MEAPLRVQDSLNINIIRAEKLVVLPHSLIGDQVRLQQVLAILLKNALRFSKSSFVYIFAAYDRLAQKLVVQVSDSGQGIVAEQLAKLKALFG